MLGNYSDVGGSGIIASGWNIVGEKVDHMFGSSLETTLEGVTLNTILEATGFLTSMINLGFILNAYSKENKKAVIGSGICGALSLCVKILSCFIPIYGGGISGNNVYTETFAKYPHGGLALLGCILDLVVPLYYLFKDAKEKSEVLDLTLEIGREIDSHL